MKPNKSTGMYRCGRHLTVIILALTVSTPLFMGCGSAETEDSPIESDTTPIATTTLVPPSPGTAFYRGNLQRTGVYDTKGVLQFTEVLWKFKTGKTVLSSPVVAGGHVFFGSGDRNLYAVDISTGLERWRFETKGQEGPHGLWGGIDTAPAVVSDTVYFTGADGYLHAVSIPTGKEMYSREVHNCCSSPAILNNTLYMVASYGLVAADTQTAVDRWVFSPIEEGGIVVASPAINDGTVYVGASNGFLYAVDQTSGKEKWKFGTGTPSSIYTTSAIGDGKVYFGGGTDDNEYFYGVDLQTGEERWRFKVESAGSDATAFSDGLVYVISGDFDKATRVVTPKRLHALDSKAGREKWRFSAMNSISTSATIVGDLVYLGSDNALYAIDKQTGQEKWKLDVPGGVTSNPSVANGVLYFGTGDGYLYAVR